MRRRVFLASLATSTAGIAGCTAFTNDTLTPTTNASTRDTATRTEAPTTTDEPERPEEYASVIDLETASITYAFGPTKILTDDRAEVALWFDRTATADHPARLTGWLRNRNDFENTFQIKWIPFVGRTSGRQPHGYGYEASLYAVPTRNNEIAVGVPDVARNGTGFWHVDDTGSWLPDLYRLDPGEQVDLEYFLVGHPEMTERPTGTYEFRGRDETVTVTVWETDSPGPDEDSRFAGRSVPAIDSETTVQWYHEANQTTGAFVRPSTEQIELDGFVEFEMINHTDETLRCGHWNLYKLVDGEWYHVGPNIHTADCRGLTPGSRKQWVLRAFNAEPVPCGTSCGTGGLTRGFLGGGEYGVVAGYGHPEDESAALVELIGDPVTIIPTDNVDVERDGETVAVTTDPHGDDEHPPDESFELTRVETADEQLIAEQIMTGRRLPPREHGLRNALAHVEPTVERVVIRADEHVTDRAIGHDEETRRFEFRGQAYEVNRITNSE